MVRHTTRDYNLAYFMFMALLSLSTIGFGAIITLLVARKIDATEAQLFDEQERYALAVRGANDGLWDWDLIRDDIYFSPRWKDMLGYEDHELANKPDEWVKRIHPDDAEKTLATLTAHLNGLSYYFESEHRLLHKDGKFRWFLMRGLALRNESGKAHRIAGSMTDVNERKRYEKHLHQNESRTRMVLDHVVDGIITTSDQGVVESMNSAAEDMFGVKNQEIVGRPFIRLLAEQHHHEFEGYFAEYSDSGTAPIVGTTLQLRGNRRNGGTFPISCTVTEMLINSERKLIVIAHDDSKQRDQTHLTALP
jgi:PAS domain S-box-containing protein